MKKYFVMIAALLMLSSCGRGSDFVIDLDAETTLMQTEAAEEIAVVINKNSMTFHLDSECSYVLRAKEENRMEIKVESLNKLIAHGYQPCGRCSKTEQEP